MEILSICTVCLVFIVPKDPPSLQTLQVAWRDRWSRSRIALKTIQYGLTIWVILHLFGIQTKG